jgi:hypothetical protein
VGKELTNVIGFRWGESADSLSQHPIAITYVADPGSAKAAKIFKELVIKEGVAYADGDKLPSMF